MIFLPWLVFFGAVLWMIAQGNKAKAAYLHRKAVEEMEKKTTVAPGMASPTEGQQVPGQDGESGVTSAFTGKPQGQTKWN